MEQESPRHVIFLGAGASYTSGYPVGDSLRLRLSCRNRFQEEFSTAFKKDLSAVRGVCNAYFTEFGDAMRLFRSGGFSTVDEFSKLSSAEHPAHTQVMKKLMCMALSFHNPEDDFHKSDYYAFVQRLFRDDELHSLRNSVTVLSYNYDCYLDYLLLRAFRHRKGIATKEAVDSSLENKLTSGFYHPNNLDWTSQSGGFNYYKLHGSMAYGNSKDFSHNHLFETPDDRWKRFSEGYYKTAMPPIVFPWELFDEKGKFTEEDDFIFVKGVKDKKAGDEGRALYELYKKIWRGAKSAVTRAHKISFVGLSAHQYMEDGLHWLFRDKTEGEVQIVVANPDNLAFKDSKNRLHPASLCGRISKILRKVSPRLKYVKSLCEHDGVFTDENFNDATAGRWQADITPRYSFKEFIQTEMNPPPIMENG